MSPDCREIRSTSKLFVELIFLTLFVGCVGAAMGWLRNSDIRQLIALKQRGVVDWATITKVTTLSTPGYTSKSGYHPGTSTDFYDFTYGGGRFHSLSSTLAHRLRVGDRVEVTYLPDDPGFVYSGTVPDNAVDQATKGWKTGFQLLGAFYVLGLLFSLVIYKQERNLLAMGYPVSAKVQKVTPKGTVSYSFVDSAGAEHRRSGQVRPAIAQTVRPGGFVDVIHPPDRPDRSRMIHEVKRVKHRRACGQS